MEFNKYCIECFNKSEFSSFFEIKEVINDIINLKRIESSYCKICETMHETENAYLHFEKVLFSDGKLITLYFNCNENTSQFICNFKNDIF